MKLKRTILLLVCLLLTFGLIACSGDVGSSTNANSNNGFLSFQIVSCDESNTMPGILDNIIADEGSIYQVLRIRITNNDNEEYIVVSPLIRFEVKLENGHIYNYSSSYNTLSLLPSQSGEINLYFRVLDGETLANATFTVSYSSGTLEHNYSFVTKLTTQTLFPNVAENVLSDYRLKNYLYGIWDHYDKSSDSFDALYSFRSDKRLSIANSSGCYDGTWDLSNQVLTLNVPDLSLSASFKIHYQNNYIKDDSLRAFTQENSDYLYPSFRRTFGTYPDSFNEAQYGLTSAIRNRYFISYDSSLIYYFADDGTGKVYILNEYTNNYNQGDITWNINGTIFTIMAGSNEIVNSVYAIGFTDGVRIYFLGLNTYFTWLMNPSFIST